MAHAIADQFTTVTSSGWSSTTKLMQATSVGGSNSVATQIVFGAASTGGTTNRMIPEGNATVVAVPTSPATWSGVGWASPVLDGANVHAVTNDATNLTITFLSGQTGWTSAPTVTWTVIAYLGEPNGGPITEIGRATSAASAAGTITLTITPTATSSGTSTSPRLCFEIYAAVGIGIGSAVSNNTFSIATAGTTARLSTGGAYTSQWARVAATTAVGSVAAARRISAARTAITTGVGSSALTKKVIPLPKTVSGIGVTATTKSITIGAKDVTGVGVIATKKTVTPLPKNVNGIGVVAANRQISASRAFGVTGIGTTSLARSIISARRFGISGVATTTLRLDIPQVALNRIIPAATADWPLNAPTKAIAGITRNSAGAVLGGATVYLVRQTDGVRITSATSNATTGAYSFTRGGDDPYNYRIVATLAGAPEVHGVTDLLVPV